MNLEELRKEIDKVDKEFIKLFEKRMDIATKIAEYKKKNGKKVLDSARQRQKLADICEHTDDEDMKRYLRTLYSVVFELSCSKQNKLLNKDSDLIKKIHKAIDKTDRMFPQTALVACQGVEGAYSQHACDKLFENANIMYMNTFEGVFNAIDKGLCRYGMLPLENSTAGSVNAIYDLMQKYDAYIVRSVRVKIDHNLLVKQGTKLKDIKEIFSHEQAINQCGEYLKTLGNKVKVTVCDNTAMAAKYVAESDRKDVAALSSRSCTELYDLECIAHSVQDKGNNYTRFICISKKLEIYPGSDKTSIMMILPHKPGALYKILSRFYAVGINLEKLESRPLPDRDFEFMFYFDLNTSIYSEQYAQIINELDELCEEYKYLGSYLEIV
ncbi:MAG: prephenate dehydratase [Clostridia bacterium]|nr:prephenate dehydratase [Clostridia bacterium]